MYKNSIKALAIIGITFGTFCSGIAQNSSQMDGKKMPPRDGQRPTFEALLEKMDKNKDLSLSLDEVEGPLQDQFTVLDTNKDGLLSKEEFEKAPPPPKRKKD